MRKWKDSGRGAHEHSLLSRKHSHVTRSFALPLWADNRAQGRRTSTRTQTRGGVEWDRTRHRLRPTLFQWKATRRSFLRFWLKLLGAQWMSETSSLRWELSARRKLWVTFLRSEFRFCSRSKHAGENKRFGLCGHDKRGPVVPRDVGLSVQNERLSEHGFGGGRGERLDARRTRTPFSVVYLFV